MSTVIKPGTHVIVRPHGMTITDAIITGTQKDETVSEGFVYTYTRTSNNANGIILPALTYRIED